WGIEVADVALEALVRLTGQKVGDYGVKKDAPLFTRRSTFSDEKGSFEALVPVYPVATYRERSAREAALKRWRAWASKNEKRLGPAREGTASSRRAYEEARDEAMARYVEGHRLIHWAQRPWSSRAAGLVRITVEEDQVKVETPAGVGRLPPGAVGGGVAPVLG